MARRVLAAITILLLAPSCSEKESGVGEERGPCYPNGTCNQGLTCASGLCVRLGAGDLGERSDAIVDGARKPDARADQPRKSDGPLAWSTVATLAGAAGSGFEDGPLASARFLGPTGLALDGKKLYVADRDNHRLRLIDLASGIVSTVAGTGIAGYLDADGAAAQLNAPTGLAMGSAGAILIADAGNHRLRAFTAGAVSTVAGNGIPAFTDGPVASAAFNSPRGVVADSWGVTFVADTSNGRLRKISSSYVSTIGGVLGTPVGVAVDSGGALLASEQAEHRIVRLVTGGSLTTFAGTTVAGFNDGDASWAQFNGPAGIFMRGTALYVADTYNHRIRVIENDKVSTVAGSKSGNLDGPRASALFNLPYAVAVDDAGVVYVADTGNNSIRRISP